MDEIIKNISWPHITLILGLVFIFVFRRSIESFIYRIRSVSKTGVKTNVGPEIQKEDEKRKKAIQKLMDLGDSPVRDKLEEAIIEDLRQKGLETEGDTIKILVRHLAATRMILDFEQIYNLIFGSQIYLLKKLNEVAEQGLGKPFVSDHFHKTQKAYHDFFNEWDVDKYMQFLLDSSLVDFHSDNYHITMKGQEFLVWMIKSGRKDDKFF